MNVIPQIPFMVSFAGYDTKQSGVEASVMLDLCEMQSTHLLPSLPGPF